MRITHTYARTQCMFAQSWGGYATTPPPHLLPNHYSLEKRRLARLTIKRFNMLLGIWSLMCNAHDHRHRRFNTLMNQNQRSARDLLIQAKKIDAQKTHKQTQ